MTYTIQNGCILCSRCGPLCPKDAIKTKANDEGYWIDPTLCDGCRDFAVPRCLDACEVGSLAPLIPKKGRYKSTLLPAAIPNIFLNGKTTPFASSLVIWETCNILAQRDSLLWQVDTGDRGYYPRSVHRGRGAMTFRLAADPEAPCPVPMAASDVRAAIAGFDIRATCVHLIFAAYATTVDCPWQDTFTLNDQHLEQCLGLDKRKDLTKLQRLTLLKNLVHQACQILVEIDWPRQGKVPSFHLAEHPVWHLLDTQYYFETDDQGSHYLIGLGFTIRCGIWAKHFLNKQSYHHQAAFYQYSSLPQSLIAEVMGHWQQHEGAIRLLLWLLFKLRLGGEHRMTVRTLLRIAYGEARLTEATTVRGAHKRLLNTFESDLETLYYYGLSPQFDPDTYPPEIQPLWARVAAIPDDADAALDFWTEDAHRDLSLTDIAPRDKWVRLLNARLLGFDLPELWQQTVRRPSAKRRRSRPKHHQLPSQSPRHLSGHAIKVARQGQNLTQRALAERMGKSQSWIRDIEKERFHLSSEDEALLRQTLEL